MPESSAVRVVAWHSSRTNENGDPMMMLLNGMHWDMPVTEAPILDSTEIWEFVNTPKTSTPSTSTSCASSYSNAASSMSSLIYQTRQLSFTGPSEPPEPWETAGGHHPRHALMVTRIIVKFEGYTGRYVCTATCSA